MPCMEHYRPMMPIKEGKDKVIVLDADFGKPLIGMSDEEVTFDDIAAELAFEIGTWNETFNEVPPEDPSYFDYETAWGWLPWWLQWSTPE